MNENLLTEDPATVVAQRVRQPRKSLFALRVVAVLHLVVFLLQPVLAGIYLSGDFDAIGLHELNAQIVTGMVAIQLVVSIVYATGGGGKLWPIWFSLVLALLEETQKGLGYERLVQFHVPLGILLLITQCAFTSWTFTTGAKVARVRKSAAHDLVQARLAGDRWRSRCGCRARSLELAARWLGRPDRRGVAQHREAAEAVHGPAAGSGGEAAGTNRRDH